MDYAEGRNVPIPLMLEVGMICTKFHCTPGTLGFDDRDPSVMRQVRSCLNLYDMVKSRALSKSKVEWERNNPDAMKFISWARGAGKSEAILAPNEVLITLPERPRGNRR